MTKLPPIIAEAARESCQDAGITLGTDQSAAYITGFEMCYDYLSETAPEFDEAITQGEAEERNWFQDGTTLAFHDGARWQWESARTQVACCLVYIGGLEDKLAAAQAENVALKAKLSEST